jgi:hypothetical protein
MLIEETILNELRTMRMMLESVLSSEQKNLKIPAAAKRLGIGQAKLRELCKKGIIPAMKLTSEKNQQYIVYIPEAMNVLTRGGYLLRPGRKPGKKSVINPTK